MPPTKAHSIAHTTGLTRRPCDTALVWSVDYISPVINSLIFSSLHSTHKQVFFSFFFKPVIRQEARLLSSTLVTCLTSQHSSACRNIRLPVRPHRNNQRYRSAPERSGGGTSWAPLLAVGFQRASKQGRGGWEGNGAPIKVQSPFRGIARGE